MFEYHPHYDWFQPDDINNNGGQRITTFFTYLRSNSSFGVTEFIDIRFNSSLHKSFCDLIVCDDDSSHYGIRFRPLSGNSIFWFNIDEHGNGHQLTYHAAHPPGNNYFKIGLNTWTRQHNFIWPQFI